MEEKCSKDSENNDPPLEVKDTRKSQRELDLSFIKTALWDI